MNCDICNVDFPAEFFPDLELGICESCMRGIEADKAQKVLIAKTKDMANQLADVVGDTNALPKVSATMAAIYSEFGGPKKFASKVHWMIEQLCTRRPFPAQAAQLMINLMKLHQTIEQSDNALNAAMLTDDQIRREQQLMLMQLVVEASADPSKKKMLTDLLRRNGMDIVEISPEKVPDSVIDTVRKDLGGENERRTSARASEGTGASGTRRLEDLSS